MTLLGHLSLSCAAFVGVNQLLHRGSWEPVTVDLLALLLTLAGTLLPDIDHPHSTIGRKVLWLSWPIRVVFGHRGITHSLIAVILIYCAIDYSQIQILNWLVVGYGFHLIGDFITPAGVPLFYPFKTAYSFPILRTGAITEFIFSVLLVSIVYVLK